MAEEPQEELKMRLSSRQPPILSPSVTHRGLWDKTRTSMLGDYKHLHHLACLFNANTQCPPTLHLFRSQSCFRPQCLFAQHLRPVCIMNTNASFTLFLCPLFFKFAWIDLSLMVPTISYLVFQIRNISISIWKVECKVCLSLWNSLKSDTMSYWHLYSWQNKVHH